MLISPRKVSTPYSEYKQNFYKTDYLSNICKLAFYTRKKIASAVTRKIN